MRADDTAAPEAREAARADVGAVARGGLLNLVGIVASGTLQFALVVVVTRALHAKAAGTLLEAIALFTIVSNAGELGADTGLVRTVSRSRVLGHAQELRGSVAVALAPVLIAGFVSGAVVFAVAPELAAVFFHGVHRDGAVSYLRLLAVFLPFAAATTVTLAATRGFGTMLPYVTIQNIALPAVRLALVAIAVAAGLGSAGVALAWGSPLAVSFAGALAVLVMLLRTRARTAEAEPRPLRRLASEFWSFAAPRGLATIFGVTVTWLDVLLVGALRSTREAGIYAAASRLAIVGAYALQAVGMAIAPQISSLLTRNEPRRVELVYRIATWWLIALSWPFYITLAVFAPFVMRVFGPEFEAGSTALLVLCLAMLVNLATGNVTMVLLMGGKSWWNLANTLVSLVLNVGLNLLLIPRFGMSGAAVAWAVSIVFVNVAPVVQVKKLLHLRPPFGTGYTGATVAAIVCYGVVEGLARLTLGMSAGTVSLAVLGATLAYALVLWRLRSVFQFDELWNGVRLQIRGGSRPPALNAAGE